MQEFLTPPDKKRKAVVFRQLLPETWCILKGTDFQTAWQEASAEKEMLQHILEQEDGIRMIWGKYHRWSKETEVLSLVGERWSHSTLMVWKQRLDQEALQTTEVLKVWQDKKPSGTSEKALDSVGVERGHGREGHVQVARAIFKDKVKDRSKFMRQFPFNLWTTNTQISAKFLTFNLFLTNFSAQLGNIGHHHPCTQLLKKSAAHTHTQKKRKIWIEKQVKP